MTNKITYQEASNKLSNVYPDLKLYKSSYKGANNPVIVKCSDHGKFTRSSLHRLIKGKGCRKCNRNSNFGDLGLTQEEAISRVRNKYSNLNFDNSVYNGMTRPFTYICNKHGSITTTKYRNLLQKNSTTGCLKCQKENNGQRIKIYTRDKRA